MPVLANLLTLESLRSQRRSNALYDLTLTPYFEIIDTIQGSGGVGGELELQPGEQRRTEKRRLSLAAKRRNLRLAWRSAPDGMLRFVIAPIGASLPGGRSRRLKSSN
jgi:hypothetical protein